MSSNPDLITPSGSGTDLENLRNFVELPFQSHHLFHIFQSSPVHTALLQLPLDQHSTTPTQHYRRTSVSSSQSSSTSHSIFSPISSLPPLIPDSEISEHLITTFPTLTLEEPPSYTPSTEEVPDYKDPGTNQRILRRIRVLQGESSYIVRQIR